MAKDFIMNRKLAANLAVDLHSNFTLECLSSSDMIKWYHNNDNRTTEITDDLSENGIFLSDNGQSLTLINIGAHNTGYYVCIVGDSVDSSHSFNVVIRQEKEQPRANTKEPHEDHIEWADCNLKCASQSIINHRRYRQSNSLNNAKLCKIPKCVAKSFWSPWSKWSTCSKPCGPGIKTRTRICQNVIKRRCVGHNFEVLPCEIASCYSLRDKLLFDSQVD